ncbi:hypothetical protein BKA69DRAFT_1103798 [Paraphysoderma sedebokerense]|nr:hypothetical protein BKA69DRAFT_1103798 [Paraphysoderma sedebokerense]
MSGRVSTGSKKQGQKYKNVTAYKHNRNSKLTKKILALPVQGLCHRCYEVIEWRKRFRKYKSLTTPKKCVGCEQKTVKDAYHVLCNPCATKKNVCAKCQQSAEIVEENVMTPAELNRQQQLFEAKLKTLTERQRRSVLRKQEKGLLTEEDKLKILAQPDDDDDFSDFDDFSDEEGESADEEAEEEDEKDMNERISTLEVSGR